MSDTTLEVLAAVMTALKASATLTNDVGGSTNPRIYTNLPDNPVFPFVFLSIQSTDFSQKDSAGMDHTVQVSVFSRHTSLQEAVAIREKVYNILNRGEAALASAGVWRSLFSGVGPVFKESDGVTWQAAAQFTITTG